MTQPSRSLYSYDVQYTPTGLQVTVATGTTGASSTNAMVATSATGGTTGITTEGIQLTT